jgi:hypothetical protein
VGHAWYSKVIGDDLHFEGQLVSYEILNAALTNNLIQKALDTAFDHLADYVG